MSNSRLEGICVASRDWRRFVRKGDTLFLRGEQPRCAFVLDSGVMACVQIGEDGRSVATRIQFVGDLLCPVPLVMGQATPCTAVALTDCYVFSISADRGAANNDITKNLFTALSTCIRCSTAMVGHLAFHTVEERLQALFHDLGRSQQMFTLSHQMIADLLGTSREVVSRVITKMKLADGKPRPFLRRSRLSTDR